MFLSLPVINRRLILSGNFLKAERVLNFFFFFWYTNARCWKNVIYFILSMQFKPDWLIELKSKIFSKRQVSMCFNVHPINVVDWRASLKVYCKMLVWLMFDHVRTNTCMKCLGKYKTAPCPQTDVLKMRDNFRPVLLTKERLSRWQRILGQDSAGCPVLHLPTENRHHPTMSRLHNHQW